MKKELCIPTTFLDFNSSQSSHVVRYNDKFWTFFSHGISFACNSKETERTGAYFDHGHVPDSRSGM